MNPFIRLIRKLRKSTKQVDKIPTAPGLKVEVIAKPKDAKPVVEITPRARRVFERFIPARFKLGKRDATELAGERRGRRDRRRKIAAVVARWGAELADKPTQKQIRKYLRAHREWRRRGRGLEPIPPRPWVRGLVEGLRFVVTNKRMRVRR